MLYPFISLLDIIFPPTLHEKAIRLITKDKIPYFFKPLHVNGVITLSSYNHREVQALIAACKFENSYLAAKILGEITKLWFETIPIKKTLIIPVPLSRERQKNRKFNQVERVFRSIKPLPPGVVISNQIIQRVRNTSPQTTLNRNDRLKNLEGAFAFNLNALSLVNSFERVIICDDVITTGATLREVRSTLVPHLNSNIEVICLATAH